MKLAYKAKGTAALVLLIILFTIQTSYIVQAKNIVPNIKGEAACLIDVQSGQVLYSKNADKLLAPASTTKIMTGLLAIENGDLEDIVTTSPTMLDFKINYGTRIYLEPGEQLTLEDMLYALLLNSANDAALAIAEHIGGDLDNFVTMMNKRAEAIGVKNTTFKNPSGLHEEGHLTTAYDLARIAEAAYSNPVFREIIHTKSRVIPRSQENVPIEMINENRLLWRNLKIEGMEITGMKTGYTSVAQNCFVASATLDGRDLIAVILKCPGGQIFNDMLSLLYYGFEEFENKLDIQVGDKISSMQIDNEIVNLLADEEVWKTRKLGRLSPEFKYNIVSMVEEPDTVKAGQVLATLEVWDGNTLLKRIPLVADRSIEHKAFKTQYFSLPLATVVGGLLLKSKKIFFRRRG